jgi:preprotein translocase subunit SecE
MFDTLKFILALVLVAAGVLGFYVLSSQPTVLRVLVVLAGVAAGASIAAFTVPGRRFFALGRESIAESKKVVWPSKKETLQTTGIVFVFVLTMALFLWLADKSIEWVLYDLILGWKKL